MQAAELSPEKKLSGTQSTGAPAWFSGAADTNAGNSRHTAVILRMLGYGVISQEKRSAL